MAIHDIIDNRSEKLVDHINEILGSTASCRFAVGYFFLSGLESIAKSLAPVKELRLLIGNTTNRETLEQIAEGYRRLELVSDKAEEQSFPKKTETKRMAAETAENIRATVELMDQTDEAEATVKILVRLIEEKRLKVRIYTKGRMHAKAYIFTYGDSFNLLGEKITKHEKGIAVVGSSNLTLSGVSHNTELNVVVPGNNNHDELVRWFDELWDESQDFDETLMNEMQQSWALAPVRPYDIYMKTLYALVKDRLEDEEDRSILWDDEITSKLANFQENAVKAGHSDHPGLSGCVCRRCGWPWEELHWRGHREALRANRSRASSDSVSCRAHRDVGEIRRDVPAKCPRLVHRLPV